MKTLYQKTWLLGMACLLCLSLNAQVSLTTINSSYTENFNSLASTATTNDISTVPAGWTFLEVGANANTTYAAGTGSSNTGNTFSFGIDAADRSFGGVLSGSLTPTVGASFTNNTGTTINELHIIYRGEQWRMGTTGRADRIDFQYSTDATALNTGNWIDVDLLDFSSPNTTAAVGLLNGNDALNSSSINHIITGLQIASGATFFIRWSDVNASGADDGLSVDDFSLTPIGIPSDQPSITFKPSEINFGDVQLGGSKISSYAVTGNNLDTVISVSSAWPSITLSLDSINFSSSASLPEPGGKIFVRFTPSASGFINSTILHTSGSTENSVTIIGNGFSQADNIIPIASARATSVGTTVTVAGRITVANELGNPAYIQDATGGIPVFDYPLAQSVEIGDSVIVTGPIGIFSNQKQISGNGIIFTVADTTTKIVQPKPIALNDLAANEGLLVIVQDVSLVNSAFVFYPQSTEKITATGIQADLRIDGDTNIPGLTKPKTQTNITGVVGRFNTNAQLLPRFKSDIRGAEEPIASSDSIPKDKTFDVVTWNLEFFGAKKEDYGNEEYGPEDENLQLQNVKKVITALHADILGVEEISNDALFAELMDSLPQYGALCSNRYSYSFNGPDNTFPPQKVCFIYDTATVKILSSRVLFESLYDSARTVDPNALPNYPGGSASSFWSSGRLPFLVTIEAKINGAKEKINLVDVHAKSGATEADRARRLYDATVLKDTLDAQFANEKVILVGDYNDDLDVSITSGAETPYKNFVADTANYLAISKALSDAGARSTVGFSDMIDHIIASNDLKKEYITGSANVFTPFTLIPNYANTTSDHLAVTARFAFEATTIRFEESHYVVSEDTIEHKVTLLLSAPVKTTSTVLISLSGDGSYGQDFTTMPTATNNVVQLELPAGSTTATFTIYIINDVRDELPEDVVFTLQPSDGISIASPSYFTLTVDDNDIPEVSFAELIYSGEEGSGEQRIKLKLSTPPATNESVTINVYNGLGVTNTDYALDPSINQDKIHVSIPAGSTEGIFTITPLADAKAEFKYEFIIFEMRSASAGLKTKNLKLSTFTIIDVRNTPLRFSVSPNPTFGPVRITCNQTITEPVEVVLRNGNGTMLYTATNTLEEVSNAVSAKIQSTHMGLFLLQISFNGEISTFRILKL